MATAKVAEAETLLQRRGSSHFAPPDELGEPPAPFMTAGQVPKPGLLHFLGTAGGTREYINPHTIGAVHVTASAKCQSLAHFVDHSCARRVNFTQPVNGHAWYAVDVRVPLRVEAYCLIRSGPARPNLGGIYTPRNWELQGSNDSVTWTTLRRHDNDASYGNETGSVTVWPVAGVGTPCRYFRIWQFGPHLGGGDLLSGGGMELYGEVVQRSGRGWSDDLRKDGSFNNGAPNAVYVLGHPAGARCCGMYQEVQPPLNNKRHYQNSGGVHLYYYNRAQGGARSWSFDDRPQNGINDWCNLGWIRVSGGPAHPPFGRNILRPSFGGVTILPGLRGEWTGDQESGAERVRINVEGKNVQARKTTGEVTWEASFDLYYMAFVLNGRADCGSYGWCNGHLLLRGPDHIAFYCDNKTVEYSLTTPHECEPMGERMEVDAVSEGRLPEKSESRAPVVGGRSLWNLFSAATEETPATEPEAQALAKEPIAGGLVLAAEDMVEPQVESLGHEYMPEAEVEREVVL